MSQSDFILDLLHKSVDQGEKLGVDFIEARYDDLQLTTIALVNDIVKQSSAFQRKGIGVMAYYNGTPGYSYTPELNSEGVKDATKRAINLAKSTDERNVMKLDFESIPAVKEKIVLDVKKHPKDYEFSEKLDMLKRGVSSIKEVLEPTSTTGMYGEMFGEKFLVNSEGTDTICGPNSKLSANLGTAKDRLSADEFPIFLPYFADVTADIPGYMNITPDTYKNCQLMTETHGAYLQFFDHKTETVLRIAINSNTYTPVSP